MGILLMFICILLLISIQDKIYKKNVFKNLDYKCYFNKEQAVEGEEIEFIEEISNRKWLPVPLFKSEITCGRWLDFAKSQSTVADEKRFITSFFMLRSFKRVTRHWKVTCLKRGEYDINKVILVSADLLGKSIFSQVVNMQAKILVLPKPLGDEELLVIPQYLSGDNVVKRHLVEDPFYISGVRQYRDGDSMNKISWSATARQQEMMVYNNDCTSKQNATIILNMQSREFEHNEVIDKSKIENAIRVAAALFDTALATNMPISFLCNSSLENTNENIITNEYFGEEYTKSLFRMLSRLQLRSTGYFSDFLESIYSKVNTTDIVIVTCYINDLMMDFARKKYMVGTNVRFICIGKPLDNVNFSDCDVFFMDL